MKKYVCLFTCVLLCFMSACSQGSDVVSTEPEQREFIESEKYYRIYRDSSFHLWYEVYNAKGEIVLKEETDRPLKIRMINDNIADIAIGMGTGITVHKYYSVKEDVISNNFTYVVANSDELVAYIDGPTEEPLDNRKIVVQNIFDEGLFYKEFPLDFSRIDTPVVDAEFSKDGTSLQITYLSGEELTQIMTNLSFIQ